MWYPGSAVVLDCIDSCYFCPISYFNLITFTWPKKSAIYHDKDLQVRILETLYIGSYMSDHVLLNLLNEFRKEISLFTTSLIKSIRQEQAYQILFII